MIEAVANQNEGGIYNTFKEGIVGIYFDEFRKENQEAFNLLKDETLSDDRKVQILSILQEQFYKKHGYEGTLPEISLTDQATSFAVDSKNSPDGKERIFISIHHLNDPNSSIASLFGHETGHLNTYDSGEKTANYMQSKIGEDDLSKQFTEREKEEYLKSIGNYYFPSMTMEEQFALASSINEKDRENYTKEYFITAGGAAHELGFARGTVTKSYYTSFDIKNDKVTEYTTSTKSLGIGTNDFGIAFGLGFYLSDNPEEIQKLDKSYGLSMSFGKVSVGVDILSENISGMPLFSEFFHPKGVRLYIGKSTSAIEWHATILDIGKPTITNEKTILEYWKDKSLPTGVRLYYLYDYKEKGEK